MEEKVTTRKEAEDFQKKVQELSFGTIETPISKIEKAVDSVNEETRWNIEMLKDFFDPTDKVRCKGRTTTLATIFVAIAKENPGKEIPIMDHNPSENALEVIMDRIQSLINWENKQLKLRGYTAKFEINYKGKLIYTIG